LELAACFLGREGKSNPEETIEGGYTMIHWKNGFELKD
jgi:hypothetical protein